MLREITKLVLGVIIVGATVYAVITTPDSTAVQYLIGISGVIIGYYFKDVSGAVYAAFSKSK
jgi:hypothetical protein